MYKQVQFTREELHAKVWAQPLLVIAREIGVSDVALGKACRKAKIPLPGRGYWAALKAGKKIKAVSLPAAGQDQPGSVQFTVLADPPPRVPPVPVQTLPKVAIPDQLLKPHPLVAEFRAAAKGSEEYNGVIGLNFEKYLRIRASKSQLPRALILMDTLIKEFERLGLTVRIGGKHVETELVLKDGTVSFRLDERTTRQEPPPKPVKKGRPELSYDWGPKYIMVGTGEFTLSFNQYRLQGCRHTWKDKRGAPIESVLHEVLESVPAWEALLKAERLEAERQKANAEAAEKRRIQAARTQEVLRRQRARLVGNLQAWERAQRLRQLVVAVEQSQPDSPEAATWLEWVREQIHLLDPTVSDLTGLLKLEVKLEPYFSGYSSWNKAPKDWWAEEE
jgi:hypothetical protein